MAFEFLKLSSPADGLLHVEMDRPPVNAVDRSMYIEIADLFANIEAVAPGARDA